MKIKLIAPHEEGRNSIISAEIFRIQRLSLALLAALTPPGHAVTIVDEAFVPDNVNEHVDLAGITVVTEVAMRAYQIAERYRQHGTKVVMGGVHPSILPDESLEHADSVVVGEGENVWPRLVSDAASGQMRKVYRADEMTRLTGMPLPRRDLYPEPAHKGWPIIPTGVETSRGCPYACEFCSTSQFWGRQCRFRPIPEVIAEIESMPCRRIFFVDDALGLNRSLAKRLFTEMIPLQPIWVGQGTVSLAEDFEFLRLLKRSGCLGLLIGFESVQREIRDGMKKTRNLKVDISEAMRRFHGEGIAILGAFVFGFDHENKDVFDQTIEFSMKQGLDAVQLRILVPFPGTRLYIRLLKERRLFVPDWWLRGYSCDTLLFKPMGMTPDELLDGFARINKELYSFRAITKRFFGLSPWKRSPLGCRAYLRYNLATRKRYFTRLNDPQPFARFMDDSAYHNSLTDSDTHPVYDSPSPRF